MLFRSVTFWFTRYAFELDRAGKFDVERARAQEVPMQIWNTLQKGMTIEVDGRLYTPDMVMGPDRKGLKVTYCTDTRPTPQSTNIELPLYRIIMDVNALYGSGIIPPVPSKHTSNIFYPPTSISALSVNRFSRKEKRVILYTNDSLVLHIFCRFFSLYRYCKAA